MEGESEKGGRRDQGGGRWRGKKEQKAEREGKRGRREREREKGGGESTQLSLNAPAIITHYPLIFVKKDHYVHFLT